MQCFMTGVVYWRDTAMLRANRVCGTCGSSAAFSTHSHTDRQITGSERMRSAVKVIGSPQSTLSSRPDEWNTTALLDRQYVSPPHHPSCMQEINRSR